MQDQNPYDEIDMGGDPQIKQEVLEQVRRKLQELFGSLEHEVPLLLFTDPHINTQYCEAARAVIRAVRELSTKVSLQEYDLSHQLAEKYNVSQSPTIFNFDFWVIVIWNKIFMID